MSDICKKQKESSNIAENVVTDKTIEDDTLAGIVGLGAIGGGIYWVKKKKSKKWIIIFSILDFLASPIILSSSFTLTDPKG